jgi:hypothetical protein
VKGACGLTAVMLVFAANASGEERLTQARVLRQMIDLDRLCVPPAPGVSSRLFSSFDRAAQTIEDGRYMRWDANQDANQFLRSDPDGWDVLADATGPGVLTRLWFSAAEGDVCVVLDGEAVLHGPLAGLFDGSRPPLNAPFVYRTGPGGGYVCYFPIGYAEKCVVKTRGYAGRYQIDATSFGPGTQVERFTTDLDPDAAQALAEVTRALQAGLDERQVVGSRKTMAFSAQDDIEPGGKLSDSLGPPSRHSRASRPGPAGAPKSKRDPNAPFPGVIRSLYASITDRTGPRELYALRHCILRIWFDDEPVPSVEAPLCDFFGSGFDRVPYSSLPMGTDRALDMPFEFSNESWFMYSFFPMPFHTGMRVEIENRTTRKLGVMLYARIDLAAPPPEAMRFHARYFSQRPLKDFDYTLLATTGPGRLVGCMLNVDCPRRDWWGEGDHKIWADHGGFPNLPGTGTADYFGDNPPLHEFVCPLHGVTRSGPLGKHSAYRWHLLDSVVFHQSLRFAVENWQTDQAADTDYSGVVYWYADARAKESALARLDPNSLTPAGLRIPGAVEIEGNVLDAGGWNPIQQKHVRVELSGEAAVSISAPEPIRVRIPRVPPGSYQLKLRLQPRRPFETVEVTTAEGEPIGTVTYRTGSDGTYDVGPIDVKAGETILRILCRRAAVLDCWVFEPRPPASAPRSTASP